MDAIFWGPDWYWPSDEAFFSKLERAIDGDSWVVDGNYTRTIPIKWKRVQTVVWIDYPFLRTLFQSLKRAANRAWTKEELWPGTGNRESFRKSFLSKDSVILWSVQNYWKVKKKYLRLSADKRFEHVEFVRLTSPKNSRLYLQAIAERLEPSD